MYIQALSVCPTPALKITVCHSAPSLLCGNALSFFLSVLNLAPKSTRFGKKTLFNCNRISFDVKKYSQLKQKAHVPRRSPDQH